MRTPAPPASSRAATVAIGGARGPGLEPRCLDSALTLDPRAPQTVYAATPRGVYKSTDGALRWHAINSGLSLTTVSSVAVDPHRPQIVYASTGPFGLFRSRDGGGQPGLLSRPTQEGRRRRYRPARPQDDSRFWPWPSGRQEHERRPHLATRRGRLGRKEGVSLAISGERAYAATSRGVFSRLTAESAGLPSLAGHQLCAGARNRGGRPRRRLRRQRRHDDTWPL